MPVGGPRGNRKLAAVEPPPKAKGKPATLRDAAELSQLEMLIKLRDMTAQQIDTGPPAPAFAALSKQFREVDSAIRAIQAKDKQEANEDGKSDPNDGWDPTTI